MSFAYLYRDETDGYLYVLIRRTPTDSAALRRSPALDQYVDQIGYDKPTRLSDIKIK